jgi:hypothetical protein
LSQGVLLRAFTGAGFLGFNDLEIVSLREAVGASLWGVSLCKCWAQACEVQFRGAHACLSWPHMDQVASASSGSSGRGIGRASRLATKHPGSVVKGGSGELWWAGRNGKGGNGGGAPKLSSGTSHAVLTPSYPLPFGMFLIDKTNEAVQHMSSQHM